MLNPLNFITKFIKSSNQKELDRIKKIVVKVNSLEATVKNLSDEDFPKKTIELKDRLNKGENIDALLPEAFALVREASKRTRNERHHDVQILGGVVLHEGKIAEMRTGEGKTLTISLAAYLNALSEKGVHIVTVNDYLAKRDSQEMGGIYKFLGLTFGFINNDQDDLERKKNYNFDITYATNSELGFDYLRDNMKFSKEQMVQRGHVYTIVDEIDSCLIDEARTPLVISGAAEDKTEQYLAIDKLIKRLLARLAPSLPSAAPAERGWFKSIVASTDARWAVRRAVRRAENAQPRRNMRAHRECRCGSREERAVRHRSWRARPHRGSPSLQSKAASTCQPIARQ